MANSSEHEFLSQAIDIPRHVKNLLIFNSHYSYVKLLFKVKQEKLEWTDHSKEWILAIYKSPEYVCVTTIHGK